MQHPTIHSQPPANPPHSSTPQPLAALALPNNLSTSSLSGPTANRPSDASLTPNYLKSTIFPQSSIPLVTASLQPLSSPDVTSVALQHFQQTSPPTSMSTPSVIASNLLTITSQTTNIIPTANNNINLSSTNATLSSPTTVSAPKLATASSTNPFPATHVTPVQIQTPTLASSLSASNPNHSANGNMQQQLRELNSNPFLQSLHNPFQTLRPPPNAVSTFVTAMISPLAGKTLNKTFPTSVISPPAPLHTSTQPVQLTLSTESSTPQTHIVTTSNSSFPLLSAPISTATTPTSSKPDPAYSFYQQPTKRPLPIVEDDKENDFSTLNRTPPQPSLSPQNHASLPPPHSENLDANATPAEPHNPPPKAPFGGPRGKKGGSKAKGRTKKGKSAKTTKKPSDDEGENENGDYCGVVNNDNGMPLCSACPTHVQILSSISTHWRQHHRFIQFCRELERVHNVVFDPSSHKCPLHPEEGGCCDECNVCYIACAKFSKQVRIPRNHHRDVCGRLKPADSQAIFANFGLRSGGFVQKSGQDGVYGNFIHDENLDEPLGPISISTSGSALATISDSTLALLHQQQKSAPPRPLHIVSDHKQKAESVPAVEVRVTRSGAIRRSQTGASTAHKTYTPPKPMIQVNQSVLAKVRQNQQQPLKPDPVTRPPVNPQLATSTPLSAKLAPPAQLEESPVSTRNARNIRAPANPQKLNESITPTLSTDPPPTQSLPTDHNQQIQATSQSSANLMPFFVNQHTTQHLPLSVTPNAPSISLSHPSTSITPGLLNNFFQTPNIPHSAAIPTSQLPSSTPVALTGNIINSASANQSTNTNSTLPQLAQNHYPLFNQDLFSPAPNLTGITNHNPFNTTPGPHAMTAFHMTQSGQNYNQLTANFQLMTPPHPLNPALIVSPTTTTTLGTAPSNTLLINNNISPRVESDSISTTLGSFLFSPIVQSNANQLAAFQSPNLQVTTAFNQFQSSSSSEINSPLNSINSVQAANLTMQINKLRTNNPTISLLNNAKTTHSSDFAQSTTKPQVPQATNFMSKLTDPFKPGEAGKPVESIKMTPTTHFISPPPNTNGIQPLRDEQL